MIYLDYNASYPLRPEVRVRMERLLGDPLANPSSAHAPGRQARAQVEEVRQGLLEALGDPEGELLFTSGGTEADNLAIKGMARRLRQKGNRLVVSAVEHHAVLHSAEALTREGFELELVPVDAEGRVDLEALEQALSPGTILVSVMQANNEVGTLQPIHEIGTMVRQRGILFHTDAVQAFGKCELDVARMPVDLVTLSAHKLGGPTGVGALYLRRGIKPVPLLHGGPHEWNLRAGTENVIGIVGFGAAAQAAIRERRDGTQERVRRLRDRLEEGLRGRLPEVVVNGALQERLPGTSNLSFPGCEGETLLMALDLAGICVSTGSACSSGSTEPSHVLVAMGLGPERIRGSIRFSLGSGTTEAEIDEAVERIPPIVERIHRSAIQNPPSTI